MKTGPKTSQSKFDSDTKNVSLTLCAIGYIFIFTYLLSLLQNLDFEFLNPYLTIRLFGHVARMDASLDISRALKTSIRGLPTDWKRPPGRPRHTWLRTLGADFQPYNLGLNSAWKYAQNREHWKHLVETATFQLGARA